MDCTKCGQTGIKYRCIPCKIPLCNVCSVSSSTKTPGYCEENYLVGDCEDCQGNGCKPKIWASTAPKPRQSSLSTFLKAKRRPSIKPSSETHRLKPQETLPLTSTSTPPATKKPRTLSTTAANGWETTTLATHLASDWPVVNTGTTNQIV